MKKFDYLLFVKKLILFFAGLWIIQTGVAIFIKANIGSDPFTVFTQGLATLLGITTGQANLVILFTFFVVILLTSRKSINIGTILAVVSAGIFIDLMTNVLDSVSFDSYNILIKCIILIIGCIIIAIGFSILMTASLGVAPNDLIPLMLQEKLKVQYRWIRITLDVTFLVIGFFLGGVVGVGTVIAALCQGPIIQFMMPKIDKILKPLLKASNEV
ncbi:MAG: DUF6198 family protein [Clostridium sp.]|uniref:YczE/YyaS/YitT family protein n=1 Tax=Clostridium sp. DSM 8431 TaxID=1761781 RepID=UPI0008F0769E|nr:DUF6198 family protein [Clostridium sp. DSM 8431]MCR4945182.1 DUF6198 family protein [Clostridium sp.]SFU77793.1 Uncharacterized membrane protein YczE [Clostridium sp. DSM 8431]